MSDKPEVNPDAPVEKSPFPLPSEEPKPVSPFASKSDIQVLTKLADAKANQTIQLVDPAKSVEVKPPVTADLVLKLLIDLPDDIYEYQKVYDTVSAMYEARLSDLTFKALSTTMFPGKKEGEPLRAASNDDERKIATSQVLIADEKFKLLTQELNEAKNELTLAKNKYEAAKIAANLLAVQ